MARIDAFFKLMSEQKASDLHLSTNNPPMLRINGDLVRVDYPALKDEELKTMVYEIAPEAKIKDIRRNSRRGLRLRSAGRRPLSRQFLPAKIRDFRGFSFDSIEGV